MESHKLTAVKGPITSVEQDVLESLSLENELEGRENEVIGEVKSFTMLRLALALELNGVAEWVFPMGMRLQHQAWRA